MGVLNEVEVGRFIHCGRFTVHVMRESSCCQRPIVGVFERGTVNLLAAAHLCAKDALELADALHHRKPQICAAVEDSWWGVQAIDGSADVGLLVRDRTGGAAAVQVTPDERQQIVDALVWIVAGPAVKE